MVALLFEVDGQRYGLDVTQVLKVLPYVRLRRLPHVPEYVAGVFRYRGAMVPVIDLSQLIEAKARRGPSEHAHHSGPASGAFGSGPVLGLLAERATTASTMAQRRPNRPALPCRKRRTWAA